MKKILLLGGSRQQIVAIKTAKKLGYHTILCDYLPDNPGQYEADKFYQISTIDKKSVYEIAKVEKIDGIFAYASDPAAPTAAYVAEQMKLPGNPYRTVETLCNKDRFRSFLKENDFHVPEVKVYTETSKAIKDSANFTYPIIVKPVDSSGSKGVTVLYTDKGLKKAVEFAFSFSGCNRIIIEEYIEKKHKYIIGGDIFVLDGKIVLWGLMNCHRDNTVNPLVPVGKSFPVLLDKEDMDRIHVTLESFVNKIGYKNGSMNVELIIDEQNRVYLIDMGPRSGGNMIPDILSDIFDVDIVEMSILCAMGEKIKCKRMHPKGYYATQNLHSNKSGIYEKITFDSDIEKYIYRKVLYKEAGDKVEYFDNATKCLGIIFMKFDSQEEMKKMIENIKECIHVNLTRGGVKTFLLIWTAFKENDYNCQTCHLEMEVAA